MIFVHSKTSDGNMSFNIGNPQEVLQNRNKFFKKLGIKIGSIVEVKQVHGNKVILIEKIIDPSTTADGIITNKAGIFLMIKTADCIPIAFYDPTNKAIGLIHAGLQGLEKGIIKSTINKIKKTFYSETNGLIVKLGPSIGPCCYRKDIWQMAENQLIQNSILKENIDNPKICTYDNTQYFSHRRADDTNTPDFRFVTILGL